jgi:DNA-binding transcriptional MerR regulator
MEAASRIPEKLFFRIGEVCELIKVQPHVLRYWETEFPMLAPQKNRAGQRVYRRKDVEMVLRIRDLLYEEKFTIAGAKKKLLEETRGGAPRTRPAAPEPPPADAPSAEQTSEETGTTALLPGLDPGQPQTGTAASSKAGTDEAPNSKSLSPQAKRVLRLLKTDLEDLLTRLNSDVKFRP